MQDNQYEEPVEGIAEVLALVEEAIISGDRRSLESCVPILRQATNTKRMLNQMEAGTFQDKAYMAKEEVNTAYQHALDTDKATVDDCFNQVIDVHGVTEEYINESKSNPSRDITAVVQENKEHPKVKKMQKNNVFDIEGLQKSTTPNQLLTNITNRRSVSDRLDDLESKVESLELRAAVTEARQDNTDNALVGIINTKDSNRNIAKGLRDRGVKMKDIAITLGVDQRTVRRWLAELKSV